MTILTRWQMRWNGGGIAGSAATTLHYSMPGDALNQADVTNLALGLQTAISDGIRKVIPGSLTVAVSSEVQQLDVATGQIVGVMTPGNGTAAMAGQGTGPYGVAQGACITLQTAGFTRGRRVKGRLFIVPLAGDSYDTDGTLGGGAVNFLQASGNELVAPNGTGAALVVYSRPTKAAPAGGLVHVVTAATVRDRVAILRSRRD